MCKCVGDVQMRRKCANAELMCKCANGRLLLLRLANV